MVVGMWKIRLFVKTNRARLIQIDPGVADGHLFNGRERRAPRCDEHDAFVGVEELPQKRELLQQPEFLILSGFPANAVFVAEQDVGING